MTRADLRISRRLRLFHEPDIVKLCYLAYDQHKSHEFMEITRRGRVSGGTSNPTAAALAYTTPEPCRHITEKSFLPFVTTVRTGGECGLSIKSKPCPRM